MNLTGKILEISNEVGAEKKRLAIFLSIFIAIYVTAGYLFELDVKLMMVIGIPVLFLGMMLTDIAHKIYASMLTSTMIVQASAEEVISTLKKDIKSKSEEYEDDYDDKDYEKE